MNPQEFTVRPAALDDVQAVVDLLNASSMELYGRPSVDAAKIRSDWQAPTFVLQTDTTVVLAPDGRLAGHAAAWDAEPHIKVFVAADVHPDYRGQGVGTLLGRWAEERGRQAVLKAPADAWVILVQERLSNDQASLALLQAWGYEVARHHLRMIVDLDGPPPEPVVPPGMTIRPYDADRELRPLVRAVDEAFRDHFGYVERPFEQEYEDWAHWLATDPEMDPALCFVAVEDQEIVGAAVCQARRVEDPDMGFVQVLAVRQPWRRRGLGLALLLHSFGQFYRRGRKRVGLGVDAQSLTGATRLYEKAGMRVQRRYVTLEKVLRPGRDLSTRVL